MLEECHLDRTVKKNTVESSIELYNVAREASEKLTDQRIITSPASYMRYLKLFSKIYVKNQFRLQSLESKLVKALEKIDDVKSQVSTITVNK